MSDNNPVIRIRTQQEAAEEQLTKMAQEVGARLVRGAADGLLRLVHDDITPPQRS